MRQRSPPIDDLSGQEVFVRKSSAYYESLLALNERLKASGKAPVAIREAPENLEDDDLLEMVNVGLIKITVVDNYRRGLLEKGLHGPDRA